MIDAFERLHGQVLVVLLLGLLTLERLPLLHRRPAPSSARWFSNLSLFLVGGLLARAAFPVSLVTLAASLAGSGVFGAVTLSPPLAWLIGFLLLDLLNYGLHRLSHANVLLWRVHLVHHSDVQVDVTTTVRHHPLESLVSSGAAAALVVVLGLSWTSVAAYALCALLVSAWSHANLRLPARLEAALGRVLVTPGAHLLHHSALPVQTDSNFGTVLSVWDRLFGTFTDPARQRPQALGLEYFRAAEDNTLAGVLLRQPVASARTLRAAGAPLTLDQMAEPMTSAAPIGLAWRQALRDLVLGLGLLAVAMAPTVKTLADQWTQSEAYRYGWLVLPTLFYALGWHWRQTVLSTRPRPSAAGIGVAAGAAVLWAAAQLMNIEIGRQLALVFMVFGVTHAALGTVFVRRWAPALGLLLFMLPSADVLQPVLRWGTAEGLHFTLQAMGFEVQRNGLWLSLGANRYFIADACSGLSHVTLLAFLGYAFGVLMYRSFWRVAALALAGAVFGVLSNLIRVNSIVLVDHWRGSQMDLAAHGHMQWVSLLIALGLMLFIVARSQVQVAAAETTDTAAGIDDRYAADVPWHRAAALWAGLVCLAITALVVANAGTGPLNASALLPNALPRELVGWALIEPPNVFRVDTDVPPHLSWRYSQGARHLQVDVVQARHRSDKLSERIVALPETEGWRDIQRRTARACSASGCTGVIHQIWRRSASTPLRHTYVTFMIGDAMTASQLLLRARTAWAVLTGDAVNPRLIAMTVDGEAMSSQELQVLLSSTAERLRDHAKGD